MTKEGDGGAERAFFIDGNSLMFRAFYALPPFTTREGQQTNAVFGFINMLLRLLDDEDPDYLAVAFDLKGPTFRHDEFDEYKAHRPKMPDELSSQVPILKEVIRAFGLPLLELEGYEADDLLGTAARRLTAEGRRVVLVTGDRDALQLVDERVRVLLTRRGITEVELYDVEAVRQRYELEPLQLIDMKGLAGDSSDNIPGVPGVGEKTAIKLLKEFDSVEGVLENIDKVGGKALPRKLEENADQARLSKRLATIDTDVPFEIDIERCRLTDPDYSRLLDLFEQLEFNQHIQRMDLRAKARAAAGGSGGDGSGERSGEGAATTDGPAQQAEAWLEGLEVVKGGDDAMASAASRLAEAGAAACWVITVPSPEPGQGPAVLGTAIAWEDEGSPQALFLPGDQRIPGEMVEALRSPGVRVITFLAKEGFLQLQGLSGCEPAFDIALANYICDPDRGAMSLPEIVASELRVDLAFMSGWEAFVKEQRLKGDFEKQLTAVSKLLEAGDLPAQGRLFETPANGDPAAGDDGERLQALRALAGLATQGAALMMPLEERFTERMADLDAAGLFDQVELPLVRVLASMERHGIRVDVPALESMTAEFQERLTEVEKLIYELADQEFNINSPLQLGVILFEELGLPVLKRTSTGNYSTSADILEQLKSSHEIVASILDYRHIAKLKSTYLDGLKPLVDPATSRIHTRFNQLVTSTGRLSSTEPNMQNIPVRDEMGRKIRRVFIPSADDWVFLCADYSQIELRVMAHLSEDELLLEAFREGQDIHTRTASEVFGVPMDQVTREMRDTAKAVNFGIIYGQTPYGLANSLGITQGQARTYIDNYFKRYSGVKEYADGIIKQASRDGYVTTMLNRRRYLPGLRSSNRGLRGFAERTARNTPIQGSAADIIKVAMVKLWRELVQRQVESKMILQVHDELIFDVPAGELEMMKGLVKATMERAVELAVPLVVDLKVGANWYQVAPVEAPSAAAEGGGQS